MSRFLFPKWSNKVLPIGIFFGLGPLGTAVVAGFWYYGTDKHFSVGYTPKQPVPYSHKLHAGDMGMDCRYCHWSVEQGAFAAVPPTQTCMNCHAKVKTDSVALQPLRDSWASDQPVAWTQVHNLPDFAYFDHSAHLNAGVGCESCHGRIDQMVTVSQVKPLTMGWCLECHRDPGPNLRDPKDITKMGLVEQAEATGKPMTRPANLRKPNPPTNCSGCHR
ncbi:MAG: cytochrome c3 family protein [Polyangiaceae bacterium]